MAGPVAALSPRFLCHAPSFRLFPLAVLHARLTSFNPSIASHDGQIYFSLRHCNAVVMGNRRYGFTVAIAEGAKDLINETSFGTLHWSGPSLEASLFEDRARGFEDVRIFQHQGRWFGLAGVPEQQRTQSLPTVSRVVMHLLSFDPKFRIANAFPIPSPKSAAWEKNWMPFSIGGDVFTVYRPVPLEICAIDLARRQAIPVFKADGQPTHWSGSSQIVPDGAGRFVGVIHRKYVLADELIFEHAFLRFDHRYRVQISAPFHFAAFGMEFCAGLVARAADFVLSFGSHCDSRAYVCTIAREDVETLFAQDAAITFQ